jgi:hypothetical protein
MNLYTEIIARNLQIDMESASKIQDFINNWYDGFRWGSATTKQIVKLAKEAQIDMADPRLANLLNYKAGA